MLNDNPLCDPSKSGELIYMYADTPTAFWYAVCYTTISYVGIRFIVFSYKFGARETATALISVFVNLCLITKRHLQVSNKDIKKSLERKIKLVIILTSFPNANKRM